MPFPFLQPIQPWAQEILQEREDNKILSVYKNPFVVITSGAKVVKGNGNLAAPKSDDRAKEVADLLGDSSKHGTVWKGCIIANSIGTDIPKASSTDVKDLTYSLGATPVGIDFDGKVIKVEDESGRKVSMPIIESLDIDTDGANNTLKTAKLTVRCFTLKQLEMFEMFFMKPGMNVLVEFGDNTLSARKRLGVITQSSKPGQPVSNNKQYDKYIDGEQKKIEVFDDISLALVNKSNYVNFCKDFSKYFRSDTKAVATYLETVSNSLGSYDRVAGKVLDYSFSINEDGTYTVNIEVSQGNQISFAIPINPSSTKSVQKSGTAKSVEFTKLDQIYTTMAADFGLDKDTLISILDGSKGLTPDKTWENEFFNFLKINREQKDTAASDKAYISLRFVLGILMNYYSGWKGADTNPFFLLQLPKFRKSEKDKIEDGMTMIPVDTSKYLISSDESIIFPRKELPKPSAPNDPKSKDAGEVFLATGSLSVDGTINKINFDTTHSTLYTDPGLVQDPKITSKGGLPFGDALNTFLEYTRVVSLWKRSYTRMDFLERVLGMVNDNNYGLFKLVFGLDKPDGRPMVLNYRYFPEKLESQIQTKIYRFKPTTIKSIVKQFSFNFEMSNLVAGMTVFNSRNVLKASADKKLPEGWTLQLPPEAYTSVDNSLFANADGWYSINQVEFENLQEVQKVLAEEKAKQITTDPPKTEDATKTAADLNEVIKSKTIKFLANENTKEKDLRPLIYTHKEFVRDYMKEVEPKKSSVSPISVSITIGGFSGLNCGEYFEIDGVPELYNKIGVFQITNIKHNVSREGWTTTIEADHRIIDKTPPKSK